MITDTETLDILRTGDVQRILEHLHGLPRAELRAALIADFVALTELIRSDEYKLHDTEWMYLPWWQEQEERENMIQTHAQLEAWEYWPDEHLEFLFTKPMISFRLKVDLDSLMDTAYLLPNLVYLSLSDQKPADPILNVRNMPRLWCIRCINSGIEEVSDSILRLGDLRKLELSKNKIRIVPATWSALQLEVLDLSENELETVPSWLFAQPSLKRLQLSNNNLKRIPLPVEEVQMEWKFLFLDGNQIEDFSFLERMKAIENLTIQGNHVAIYPVKLPIIHDVKLDSDQWNRLAPLFPLGLRSITISKGHATALLNQIGPAVETVCGLSMIKLEIESSFDLRRFSSLKSLHLESVGGFSELPQVLFDLQQLETISFLDCHITSLAGPWSGLRNLKSVTFSSCGIVDIPQAFFSLPRKVEIDLEDNPIPVVQKMKLKRHFKDLNI
ncbi:MAG: leucine-rich repeat domain-containing protein [Bacteroidia bacterium]